MFSLHPGNVPIPTLNFLYEVPNCGLYSDFQMVHPPKFWQALSSTQKKETVISVVLVVVVLGGTFGGLALTKVFLHTDYPFVVVTSGSMEPTIYRGDILILEGKEPVDITLGTHENRLGDIILYDSHGIWTNPIEDPIVHRVVGRTYDDLTDTYYFITQGDANSVTDPPVPDTHVLGVVRHIIPKVGMVKIWFTEIPGLAIGLIGGFVILFVISTIRDIRNSDEEDEQKKKLVPSESPTLPSSNVQDPALGI